MAFLGIRYLQLLPYSFRELCLPQSLDLKLIQYLKAGYTLMFKGFTDKYHSLPHYWYPCNFANGTHSFSKITKICFSTKL